MLVGMDRWILLHTAGNRGGDGEGGGGGGGGIVVEQCLRLQLFAASKHPNQYR